MHSVRELHTDNSPMPNMWSHFSPGKNIRFPMETQNRARSDMHSVRELHRGNSPMPKMWSYFSPRKITSRPHACGESGVCVYRFVAARSPGVQIHRWQSVKVTSAAVSSGRNDHFLKLCSILYVNLQCLRASWSSELFPLKSSGIATFCAKPALGSSRRGSG